MTVYDLIERHEGKRLKPYRDQFGNLTIGYGRDLDAEGVSDEEAEMLLHNDIDKFTHGLSTSLPWFQELDAVREAALVDVTFNVGLAGMLAFHHTLSAMAAHDWQTAASQIMASKWAMQVPVRAEEISKMIETGCWPGVGEVS